MVPTHVMHLMDKLLEDVSAQKYALYRLNTAHIPHIGANKCLATKILFTTPNLQLGEVIFLC